MKFLFFEENVDDQDRNPASSPHPSALILPPAIPGPIPLTPGAYRSLKISVSMVISTSSPTTTPPVSIALFQFFLFEYRGGILCGIQKMGVFQMFVTFGHAGFEGGGIDGDVRRGPGD